MLKKHSVDVRLSLVNIHIFWLQFKIKSLLKFKRKKSKLKKNTSLQNWEIIEEISENCRQEQIFVIIS